MSDDQSNEMILQWGPCEVQMQRADGFEMVPGIWFEIVNGGGFVAAGGTATAPEGDGPDCWLDWDGESMPHAIEAIGEAAKAGGNGKETILSPRGHYVGQLRWALEELGAVSDDAMCDLLSRVLPAELSKPSTEILEALEIDDSQEGVADDALEIAMDTPHGRMVIGYDDHYGNQPVIR